MRDDYYSEWGLPGSESPPGRVFIGAVCRDHVLSVSRFTLGRKNPLQGRIQATGGGAGNNALWHRRLAPGVTITLLAGVGDDRDGQELLQHMRAKGIDMPWPPLPHAATSCSFVLNHDGVGTVLFDHGARRVPVPLDLVEQALVGAAACCLVSPGRNEQIAPILRLAARRRVPVFFGISSAQLELKLDGLRDSLAGPVRLLICNRAEAAVLTGEDDVHRQLAALRSAGVIHCVVITDGAAGLHALAKDTERHVAAHDDGRPVLDDLGAGDAAQAGIVHSLLEGATLDEALACGVRLGFEACTAVGATTALEGRTPNAYAAREAAQV